MTFRPRVTGIFLSTLVLALAGCVTMRPHPISPAESLSSFESRTLDNSGLRAFLEKNLGRRIDPWPPRAWNFDMLTLTAFYYHPDIDVARAQWESTRAGEVSAGVRPTPDISLNSARRRDAQDLSPWTLTYVLTQPIETAGKRGIRITQAKEASESSRWNLAATAWRVRSRLRKTLLDLQKVSQAEEILGRERQIREEIERQIETQGGGMSQLTVSQARIALNETLLSFHDAAGKRRSLEVELAGAIGVPPAALDAVVPDFSEFDSPPEMSDSFLRAARLSALLNRADILAALSDYAAAESALKLEIAKQYPDVQIGPGYEWDQGNRKWLLGISLPVSMSIRQKGEIAGSVARRRESAARFTAIQAGILGEIDRASAAYRASLEKLQAARDLWDKQKTHQQILKERLHAGESGRFTLLNAQLVVTSSEFLYAEAFAEMQNALGVLEDAVQRPLDHASLIPEVPEKNPRPDELGE